MLISRFFDAVRSVVGIGLVGAGVLWESLFGPSLAGWAIIGVGLAIELLAEPPGLRRTPLDWPILLLIIMGGLSVLVTATVDTTLLQVTRLGAGLAGFYGLVQWTTHQRQRFLSVAIVLMIAGVLLAAMAPVAVNWNEAKGIPIPASIYEALPLLASDVVHPNVMAALLVLLFPLPLAYLLSQKPGNGGHSLVRWGLAAAACGLMAAVLILTKSRGGYIAGAVGGLMVIWLSRRRVLASVLALVLVGLSVWLLSTTSQPAPEVVNGITNPGTWAFRQEVWRVAIRMIGDFPFTGVGMGTFNDVATRLYPFPLVKAPGAHNLFLQVGVDLGILGLIAYLSILFSTVTMGLITIRDLEKNGDRPLRIMLEGALAGMVALMVHGLVDITVWGTRAAFVPWLVIGFIVAAHIYTRSALDAD